MTLFNGYNERVALFCTAVKKPSTVWLSEACERASKEAADDEPLVLVEEDEVNTTGWSIQQVAEWVVKNMTVEEDDRACSCFVVADEKSEVTDSLVIVALKASTFGGPEYDRWDASDLDDDEDYQIQVARTRRWQKEMILKRDDDAPQKALDSNQQDKGTEEKATFEVKFDRVFRASPEHCSWIPSLVHCGIREPWQYEAEGGDPWNPDRVYLKYPPPSAEEQARRALECKDFVSGVLSDESGECDDEYWVTRVPKRYCRTSLEEWFPVEFSPIYRLANGMFLTIWKIYDKRLLQKNLYRW